MKRKPRCDRNHVVYMVTCKKTGERYVGITVVRGRAFLKSMMLRWKGHVHHATVENRPYPIHQRIREFGENAFSHEIITIVRGKQLAHETEKELIERINPELNIECTTKKQKPVLVG
jgi:hypothetical protein